VPGGTLSHTALEKSVTPGDTFMNHQSPWTTQTVFLPNGVCRNPTGVPGFAGGGRLALSQKSADALVALTPITEPASARTKAAFLRMTFIWKDPPSCPLGAIR
jgi:hypothetical protein